MKKWRELLSYIYKNSITYEGVGLGVGWFFLFSHGF